MKKIYTSVFILIFYLQLVGYTQSGDNYIDIESYQLSVTQEVLKEDIRVYNSDFVKHILPYSRSQEGGVYELFGGKENFSKFFNYVVYTSCILTDLYDGTLEDGGFIKVGECEGKYGNTIEDISDIVAFVRNRASEERYSENKDLINAVIRVQAFYSRHRVLFPAINEVMDAVNSAGSIN